MRKLLLLLMMLVGLSVSGQKQATHWVFGGFSGLDFSCSPPQLEVSAFDGLEGGAVISDPSGSLLFYTNGNSIWNKNFQIMSNGDSIGGLCSGYNNYASSSQSSIIIPYPGKINLYYVFTTDCAEDNFVSGLRYSIVDMSLQDGLGDVTIKNQPLVAPTAEKLAAVFHANGTDVWVVTHGVLNNTFYAYLISSAGLITTPVVSNSGQVHPGGRGYLKFSPDGKKMVATCFIYGTGQDGILPEVFNFDDSSGIVTSALVLPSTFKNFYGASFSPSGNILYLKCGWSCASYIEQYNLLAGTPQQIFDTRYQVSQSNYAFGALQLGIDGKLYFQSLTPDRHNHIGVINHPDQLGVDCALQDTLLTMPCSMFGSFGLPNFIESYFKTVTPANTSCSAKSTDLVTSVKFSYTIDCDGRTVHFYDSSEIKNIEIESIAKKLPLFTLVWNYGDGTGTSYTNHANPIHIYDAPGSYSVTLSVEVLACPIISMRHRISIAPLVSEFTVKQSCQDFTVQFENNSASTSATWHWNFGDAAADSVSNLSNPSHTYKTPGTYLVSLFIGSNCLNAVVKETVKIDELLNFSLGRDTLICPGEILTLAGPVRTDASYFWNNGSIQENTTVQSDGQYWLKISRDNCSFSDTIKVVNADCENCIRLNFGCDDCNITIPTVFTPNSDGINDTFILASDCQDFEFELEVYNRWGERVFKSTDSASGWDGKIQGREASPEIYFFFTNYSFTGASRKGVSGSKKGWLGLVK